MHPPLVVTEMHDGWGKASHHQEKLMTPDEAAAVLSASSRSGPGRRTSTATCIRRPRAAGPGAPDGGHVAAPLRDAGCEVHEQVGGTGEGDAAVSVMHLCRALRE